MNRILGIDPGFRTTGLGVIDSNGNHNLYVVSGIVKVAELSLSQRLKKIHNAVKEVIDEFKPDLVAIEKVFVHKNVDSALKLGQARGAAICAAAEYCIEVSEYAPREIKKAVVGTGTASKQQIQHMVQMILALPEELGEDASDALAVALCHAHHFSFNKQIQDSLRQHTTENK